jgi:hypothetical protein
LEVSKHFFEWLIEHFLHPFPTSEEVDTMSFAAKTSPARAQTRMHFIRFKVWKPAIRNLLASNGIVELEDVSHSCDLRGPSPSEVRDAMCSKAAQVTAEDFEAWRLECEGVIAERKRARTEQ